MNRGFSRGVSPALLIPSIDPAGLVDGDLLQYSAAEGKFRRLPSGSSVAATGGSTIAPAAPTTALTFTSPTYSDDTRPLILINDHLADNANNATLVDIEHSGNGGNGTYQAYGLNIHNLSGAGSAFVIHQYSNQGQPAVWLDNTGHYPALRIKATENAITNPNSTGTGDYLELMGYAYASYTDGQGINGSTGVGSAALWNALGATAIGRSFLTDQVAQLPEPAYVASVPQTTLNASMNGLALGQATINVESVAGFQATGTLMITSGNGTQLVNYGAVSVGTGPGGCDQFTGCSGGAGTLATGGGVRQYVLSNAANSTTAGMTVLVSTGAGQTNGRLLPNLRFTSANALLPWTFANSIGTTVVALQVRQYSGTTALHVNNQNSGDAIRVTTNSAGTSIAFSVLASGQIKTAAGNEATGAGSALLGANSPAVTVTAPYTWLKFTSSDGSQVYVPAWK